MRMPIALHFHCVCLALASAAAVGCSGPFPAIPGLGSPAAAAYISATANTVPLAVGDVKEMAPLMHTPGGQIWSQPLAWTSGNPAVATIDPTSGRLTAVAPGTAIVIAASQADPTVRAVVEVDVSKAGSLPTGTGSSAASTAPSVAASTSAPSAGPGVPAGSASGSPTSGSTPGTGASAAPTPVPKPAVYAQASGTTDSLRGVQYVDDKTAYAIGGDHTILKTADGGVTWTPTNTAALGDSSADGGLQQLSFVSGSVGWVLADHNKLYRTSDGGDKWEAVTLPATVHGNTNTSLSFTSATSGFIGTTDGVFKTADAGDTWTEMPGTTGVNSLAVQGDTLLAVGSDGFYRFAPGLGWSLAFTDPARAAGWPTRVFFESAAVSFVSPTTGWMLELQASSHALYQTTDGGNSWRLSKAFGVQTRAVQFISPTVGWVLAYSDLTGTGQVLETKDGGATWDATDFPRGVAATCMSMRDATHGFFAGPGGSLLKYAVQ